MTRQSSSKQPCVFCAMEPASVIAASALAYVVRDVNPVTALHTLIVPKRHVASYFDLHQAERNSIEELMIGIRDEILRRDGAVCGFNIGINVGEAAGQTIFHCHVHLIPRRVGDVRNPRGGVRAVIPGKASY